LSYQFFCLFVAIPLHALPGHIHIVVVGNPVERAIDPLVGLIVASSNTVRSL